MNWDAIGAVAELLGAIGVIASLAYLALQIRQNSALLSQTAEAARANAAVTSGNYGAEFMTEIALDADLSRIWRVGRTNPEALEADERGRFYLLMIAQLIQMDVNYALLRGGALDKDIHGIWDRMLDDWLQHPDFVKHWTTGALPRIATDTFGERVNARIEAARRTQQGA
jgi:hypothetical protein